jgi:predicted nuclease of restriction endonuclease-like (RecB) superfamily
MNAADTELYERIATILAEARASVARTVNTAMVHAYWHIGREIVEVAHGGKGRARYGDGLMRRLAARLSKTFGKGFGLASLKRMKQFYLAFPQGSALTRSSEEKRSTPLILSPAGTGEKGSTPLSLSAERPARLFPPSLAWSHYLILLRVRDERARAFYEIEAARETWSVRELERQIAALLFERIAMNKDKTAILALARDGQEVAGATDVIKDPFVLEFLDLREKPTAHERDLEQAIIDRLEEFLREMGKGFCFVARQKRLTLDGDHFYVDLVFYNRLLRCFVLVDLKLGKLTHQDLGQMQMYVNYFDRYQRAEHEAKTIGIVLCSEKNDAMVRITMPAVDAGVVAARYQMYLPSGAATRVVLIAAESRAQEPQPIGQEFGPTTRSDRNRRSGRYTRRCDLHSDAERSGASTGSRTSGA